MGQDNRRLHISFQGAVIASASLVETKLSIIAALLESEEPSFDRKQIIGSLGQVANQDVDKTVFWLKKALNDRDSLWPFYISKNLATIAHASDRQGTSEQGNLAFDLAYKCIERMPDCATHIVSQLPNFPEGHEAMLVELVDYIITLGIPEDGYNTNPIASLANVIPDIDFGDVDYSFDFMKRVYNFYGTCEEQLKRGVYGDNIKVALEAALYKAGLLHPDRTIDFVRENCSRYDDRIKHLLLDAGRVASERRQDPTKVIQAYNLFRAIVEYSGVNFKAGNLDCVSDALLSQHHILNESRSQYVMHARIKVNHPEADDLHYRLTAA